MFSSLTISGAGLNIETGFHHEDGLYICVRELDGFVDGVIITPRQEVTTPVKLVVDNTAAIFWILKGSTKPSLRDKLLTLMKELRDRQLYVCSVAYIRSADNVRPDEVSRIVLTSLDSMLNPRLFESLLVWAAETGLPLPVCDGFATQQNARCKKYISWRIEPNSSGVDFFSCELDEQMWPVWCHSPFSLVSAGFFSITSRKLDAFLLITLRQSDQLAHDLLGKAKVFSGPWEIQDDTFVAPRGCSADWPKISRNFKFAVLWFKGGILQ